MRYGPQLIGKKLSDNEVYKLLALADLDSSFYSKSGGELSVGQAQRVALARTLANEPQVLTLQSWCKIIIIVVIGKNIKSFCNFNFITPSLFFKGFVT